MLKRISEEKIGLLEWESATLDMSFVDDYKEEVIALLQAQVNADQEKVEELSEEIDVLVTQLINQRFIDEEVGVFLRGRVRAMKEEWGAK